MRVSRGTIIGYVGINWKRNAERASSAFWDLPARFQAALVEGSSDESLSGALNECYRGSSRC